MREGLAYKIVGGVRFYGARNQGRAGVHAARHQPPRRCELRRVIKCATRGIGKGVMDSLEKIELSSQRDDEFPLCPLAWHPQSPRTRSGPASLHGLQERAFTGRAAASLTTFRNLIVA
jgi:hypothetical protein